MKVESSRLLSLFILTFWLLFNPHLVSSQNIARLDSKFGFKTLKFRTPPDISNCTKIESMCTSKEKVYEYTKRDFYEVNDVLIKQVILSYYNNQLYNITVIFFPTDESKFDKMKNSLSYLYGVPNVDHGDSAFWGGSKVHLLLAQSKEDSFGSFIAFGLSITDSELDLRRTQDEF